MANIATDRLVAIKDYFLEFDSELKTTIGTIKRHPPSKDIIFRAKKSTAGDICVVQTLSRNQLRGSACIKDVISYENYHLNEELFSYLRLLVNSCSYQDSSALDRTNRASSLGPVSAARAADHLLLCAFKQD
jgi:hypothetical protein